MTTSENAIFEAQIKNIFVSWKSHVWDMQFFIFQTIPLTSKIVMSQ